MNKKRITLLILVALSFSSLPLVLFIVAEPAFVLPNYEPLEWQSGAVGEGMLPKFDPDIDYSGFSGASSAISGLSMSTPPVGTVVNDWYVGAISGDPTMTLRAVGDFVEVWVQNDLSFPDGDPRNEEPWLWQITDGMAQYLADEFDNTIYSTIAGYYDAPLDRDGTNTIFQLFNFPLSFWEWIETTDPYNPQRVILKIINYRDDNYYDPTYPSYVAGFFSSTYTDYYNRNMVHLDCWEWAERLGPEGYSWLPEHSEIVVDRPNLYESVLAHEFQHNIHRDHVEDPPLWMNEACSLFAEPLCGYELDLGQVEWFLATPDNSLTEWGDQGDDNILADYGAAFLWSLYLTDHYGIDIMGEYVQNGGGGIEGLNALLPRGRPFEKIFRDWRIANLLQTDHGKYGYRLKQLRKYYNPTAEINWDELYSLTVHEYSGEVPWTSAVEAFGETYGKPYIPYGETEYVQDRTFMKKLPTYGSEYIKFTNLDEDVKFYFQGDSIGTIALWPYEQWEFDGDMWHANYLDLINSLIATEVEVPVDNPYLELYTYWDIEDYWDFGFVQVSTDGGVTWTSLWDNEGYSTDLYDPGAIDYVINNVPGLTGWSEDFQTLTYDLSFYAGETVLIGFRFATDWAVHTPYTGWFLDEVLVKSDSVSMDIIEDLATFYPLDLETGPSDYFVDLVFFEVDDGEIEFEGVNKVRVNDLTDYGTKPFELDDDEFFIAVISPDNGEVDYQFSVMEFDD